MGGALASLRLQRQRLVCRCVPRSRSPASAAAAGAPWCRLPCKGWVLASNAAKPAARQRRAGVPRPLWRIGTGVWVLTSVQHLVQMRVAKPALVFWRWPRARSLPPLITPKKVPPSQRVLQDRQEVSCEVSQPCETRFLPLLPLRPNLATLGKTSVQQRSAIRRFVFSCSLVECSSARATEHKKSVPYASCQTHSARHCSAEATQPNTQNSHATQPLAHQLTHGCRRLRTRNQAHAGHSAKRRLRTTTTGAARGPRGPAPLPGPLRIYKTRRRRT